DGGELRGAALDGVLRIHDLADGDAGKIELHRQRLGEQAGIALGDTRTAAGADLDLDDALSFQRSQRVGRDDAAHAETLGQILFGAEEIARAKLFGEQRVAHLNDDLRRHGRGAEGNNLPLAALHGWMQPHASLHVIACARSARAKVAMMIKMISFPSRPFVGWSGWPVALAEELVTAGAGAGTQAFPSYPVLKPSRKNPAGRRPFPGCRLEGVVPSTLLADEAIA